MNIVETIETVRPALVGIALITSVLLSLGCVFKAIQGNGSMGFAIVPIFFGCFAVATMYILPNLMSVGTEPAEARKTKRLNLT
ncbi:hypothetical protein AOZ07_01485 [Glutamicibacter halophytocola]|uniref:hypothetical protein n=1 Tax=Glutamicibacter halophytocola TaxID=1933880 RepID=UPI0006D4BF58|nr:hypothetical protein [Glutamicibacter halophytocola]ALG27800.1 hypothetical protein AOZ07_01485 [Glutamicibacter halophytocola]